eukprot:144533-Ditylum_brightwellii.AAC.1
MLCVLGSHFCFISSFFDLNMVFYHRLDVTLLHSVIKSKVEQYRTTIETMFHLHDRLEAADR